MSSTTPGWWTEAPGWSPARKCKFTALRKEFTISGKPASATREDIPIGRLTPRARRLYQEHIGEAEYNTRAKEEKHLLTKLPGVEV